MTTDSDDAHAAELRHLRAEIRRLQEDNEDLRERLAGRDQEIRALRAKVVGTVKQAAAPRENPG